MAKQRTGYKPEIITREALPKIRELKGGQTEVVCPFCKIPHPIAVGKKASCGTDIRVLAVQSVIPARTVRKFGLKCIKCGESGGEMTLFNDGYVHLVDCKPEVNLMVEPPKQYNLWAKFVYGLPESLRTRIEARTGPVKRIEEIDPQGKETGRTLGYVFAKGVS